MEMSPVTIATVNTTVTFLSGTAHDGQMLVRCAEDGLVELDEAGLLTAHSYCQ